ncbi:MAG: hypothetical protein ABT940_06355 [Alphaproteobacteria bacterium]
MGVLDQFPNGQVGIATIEVSNEKIENMPDVLDLDPPSILRVSVHHSVSFLQENIHPNQCPF